MNKELLNKLSYLMEVDEDLDTILKDAYALRAFVHNFEVLKKVYEECKENLQYVYFVFDDKELSFRIFSSFETLYEYVSKNDNKIDIEEFDKQWQRSSDCDWSSRENPSQRFQSGDIHIRKVLLDR